MDDVEEAAEAVEEADEDEQEDRGRRSRRSRSRRRRDDDESSDDKDDAEGQAEEEVEEEPEPEPDPGPDNLDAIAALKELGCRADLNDNGRVWRIFLYEKHGDNALAQIHGLPSLKEIWTIGSKVTKPMLDRLQETLTDKVKIYS